MDNGIELGFFPIERSWNALDLDDKAEALATATGRNKYIIKGQLMERHDPKDPHSPRWLELHYDVMQELARLFNPRKKNPWR